MYKYYISDTRGWIRVKKDELDKVNLLGSISTSSYVKGDYIYLDEDVDFSFFIYCFIEFPDLDEVIIEDDYFDNYKRYEGGLE